MKMQRFLCILIVALLALTVSISASAINPGYRGGEIVLVSESNSCSSNLQAYREGVKFTDMRKATWEDGGVHDKALRLNGKTDYLLYEDANIFKRPVTVASWVKWYGSMDKTDKSYQYNQRLFTLYRDEKNYVSVNMHAFKEDLQTMENGASYRIDGIYIEYVISGATGKKVDAYNLTTGAVSYSIPVNTWTHIALVMDDVNLKLYINGAEWFSKALPSGASELAATALKIGAGMDEEEPTLNASIDDAAIFAEGLPIDCIQALAGGASLDFENITEKTIYMPKEPKATTTEAKGFLAGLQSSEGSKIPWFTWYAVAGVAVIFGILVLIVNLKPAPKEEGESIDNLEIPETKTTPIEPVKPKAPVRTSPARLVPETEAPMPPVKQTPVSAAKPVAPTPKPAGIPMPSTQKPTVPTVPPMSKPVAPAVAVGAAVVTAGMVAKHAAPAVTTNAQAMGATTARHAAPEAPKPMTPAGTAPRHAAPESAKPVMPSNAVARHAAPETAVPTGTNSAYAAPRHAAPESAQRPQQNIPQKPQGYEMSAAAKEILAQTRPISIPKKPVANPVPAPAPKPMHQVEKPTISVPSFKPSTEQAKKTMAIDDLIDDILLEKYLKSSGSYVSNTPSSAVTPTSVNVDRSKKDGRGYRAKH